MRNDRECLHPPACFDHRTFAIEDLLRRKESVCVMLPAREEAASIRGILDVLLALQKRGAIDDVLVIDASSVDGTGQIAAARGARVLQRDSVLSEFGPALGKGDAVWRGISATDADIVCVLDADLVDFEERFVVGLVGPLLRRPSLQMVKGSFERPFCDPTGAVVPGEGGRVTELMARPLLRLWCPELAAFDQPLSGQWAARRELLIQLRFWTGYALEICLLIESYEFADIAILGQSYLGSLQNRHRTLTELSSMAYQVLLGVTQRLDCVNGPEHVQHVSAVPEDSRQVVTVRPPLVSLGASAGHRLRELEHGHG